MLHETFVSHMLCGDAGVTRSPAASQSDGEPPASCQSHGATATAGGGSAGLSAAPASAATEDRN